MTGRHRSRYLRSLIFTQTRRILASEVLNHNYTLQMLKMLKGQSILIRGANELTCAVKSIVNPHYFSYTQERNNLRKTKVKLILQMN